MADLIQTDDLFEYARPQAVPAFPIWNIAAVALLSSRASRQVPAAVAPAGDSHAGVPPGAGPVQRPIHMIRQPRPVVREVEETIMVRLTFIFIVLSACGGAISAQAIGQVPLTGSQRHGQSRVPLSPGLAGSTEPDPLPGLPRPPDQPNTLFQAAPATQMYGCRDLECPYFEKDPLLDPDCLPQPGWLFDVEMDILGTHVVNHVGETDPPSSPA